MARQTLMLSAMPFTHWVPNSFFDAIKGAPSHL
jgi:hypothetical protein